MLTYINRRAQTREAWQSVKDVGRALGMSEGWIPDPGRLEDAIGGTLANVMTGKPDAISQFSGPVDDSNPNCHGLAGIFGGRFTAALAKDGRKLHVTVDCQKDGLRLTWGDYRLSLV